MAVQEHVRVGVGCFVTYRDPKDNQKRFLIGQRKGSHGANTWALPGGHLEMNEDFETCAEREVLEETDLKLDVNQIKFITAMNNIMQTEQCHYVTIFMYTEIDYDMIHQVKVMEPEKLQGTWQWVTKEEVRNYLLFSPLQKFMDEQKDLKFLD